MDADLEPAPHYSLLEDIQGLIAASVQAALGIHMLRAAGLITGGTAGLALLMSYATGWGFGAAFFAVNLPFYAFAYARKGLAFTIKSFVSVTAVSFMAEGMAPYVPLTGIHPAAAAILFGVSAGVGLLGLFRHTSSLGGVSIVAVILQDRLGIRAGWVLLAWDLTLFLAAFAFLQASAVIWSMLGAAILNFIVAMNHRRDWYVVN